MICVVSPCIKNSLLKRTVKRSIKSKGNDGFVVRTQNNNMLEYAKEKDLELLQPYLLKRIRVSTT